MSFWPLQNITPDPGVLSQPTATVIAGFLAVLGAAVAFCGVLYAQRSQRRQLQAQLDAEVRKQERADRFDALTNAAESLSDSRRVHHMYFHEVVDWPTYEPGATEFPGEIERARACVRIARIKLRLLKCDDSVKAFDAVADELSNARNARNKAQCFAALKEARNKLDNEAYGAFANELERFAEVDNPPQKGLPPTR